VKKTISFSLLATMFLTNTLLAADQQTNKIPKIGTLQSGSKVTSPENVIAFRNGLRDLGYVEGKNILVEYRYADGKPGRLSELAAEIVQLKVDVIVAAGTQTTTAAKQATSTIPIVAGAAGDLVRTGLVASLARPGGNVTGLDRYLAGRERKANRAAKRSAPQGVACCGASLFRLGHRSGRSETG
jgi:putative ABC transport system substrate-binding protein